MSTVCEVLSARMSGGSRRRARCGCRRRQSRGTGRGRGGAARRHSERKGALPLLSFRLTRVRDSFVCRVLLRFGNRADGAAVFTSSAVDALVRVDDVFAVTLGDCRDGAGVCARSARNAFIADNSCHGVHSFQRIGLPTDNIISHARGQFNRLNEKHPPDGEKFAMANL